MKRSTTFWKFIEKINTSKQHWSGIKKWGITWRMRSGKTHCPLLKRFTNLLKAISRLWLAEQMKCLCSKKASSNALSFSSLRMKSDAGSIIYVSGWTRKSRSITNNQANKTLKFLRTKNSYSCRVCNEPSKIFCWQWKIKLWNNV